MAKIAKKTVTCDGVTGRVQFDFMDGTTQRYGLNDLSEEMVIRLAVHGLSQKLGDTYAGATSVKEAKGMVEELFTAMVNGDWTIKGERTGTGGILAEALSVVTGQPLEACAEKLREMEEEQTKALKKNPQIKAVIAEINLERAKAKAKATATDEGEDLSALFN